MTDSSELPRIFVWCWPRTVSTALGKCLSNVEGVQYWHEPYQNCLNTVMQMKAATEQPQKPFNPKFGELMAKLAEKMASFDGNDFFAGSKLYPSDKFTYDWVKEKLEEDEPGKKFIVIKDMAMSIVDYQQYLPAKVPKQHIFLIRHPLRVMKSMTVSIENICKYIGMGEVDFEIFRDTPMSGQGYFQRDHAYFFWKHVRENVDSNPVVIDSEDLCRFPEKILPKLFKALSIPYDAKYLSWNADEEILKSWKGSIGAMVGGRAMKSYDRAFQSSSFVAPSSEMPKLEEIPTFFRENYDTLLKSYKEMHANRLRPDE